jgi:hypothetical protein
MKVRIVRIRKVENGFIVIAYTGIFSSKRYVAESTATLKELMDKIFGESEAQ